MNPFNYLFYHDMRKNFLNIKGGNNFIQCDANHIGQHREFQKLLLLEQSDDSIMFTDTTTHCIVKPGSMERYIDIDRIRNSLMFLAHMKSYLARYQLKDFIQLRLSIQLIQSVMHSDERQGFQLGFSVGLISMKNAKNEQPCFVVKEILYWVTRRFVSIKNSIFIKNFFLLVFLLNKKNTSFKLRDLMIYVNEFYHVHGVGIQSRFLMILTDLLKNHDFSLDEILDMMSSWDFVALQEVNSDILCNFMAACIERANDWDRRQKRELIYRLFCLIPCTFDNMFAVNLSKVTQNLTRLDHMTESIGNLLDFIVADIASSDVEFFDEFIEIFNCPHSTLKFHPIRDNILLQLTHKHILNRMMLHIEKKMTREIVELKSSSIHIKMILFCINYASVIHVKSENNGFIETLYNSMILYSE